MRAQAKATAKAQAKPTAKAKAKATAKAKAKATAKATAQAAPGGDGCGSAVRGSESDGVSGGTVAAGPYRTKREPPNSVDEAWVALHADTLKTLPADCAPQSSRVGRWSYTLRAPNSSARVEVLLRGRAFYVKQVASTHTLPPKPHVPWKLHASPAACWAAVLRDTGYA